jgi:tyrosyl-tRNA synthetase
VLATEATAIVHGRDAADEAAETARQTFEAGGFASDLPSIDVAKAELAAGIGLLSLIVKAGLAASNGEARRHVQAGAVKLNDAAANDDRQVVSTSDVTGDGVVKLSLGKKKHILIRPV